MILLAIANITKSEFENTEYFRAFHVFPAFSAFSAGHSDSSGNGEMEGVG